MAFTEGIVPRVKTELDFNELDTLKYTSYSRLLDKQLCQYLALNKTTNLSEEKEKETIQTMLSLNIYSVTEECITIDDCSILTTTKLQSKEDYTGCVILQTKTKNDTCITSIRDNLNLNENLQYNVSDFIALGKDVTAYFPSYQELLVFNIKKCSKTKWIDAINLAIKPTR